MVQVTMAGWQQRAGSIRRMAPVLLVPAGAFAVHQLRYWLAFGHLAGTMLERQGHAYLGSVIPWIVLALGLAVGSFLRALGRAFGGQRSLPRYTCSFAALWLLCAAGLLVIFLCQETLEGVLATGHPAGLAGVFGYGGWWAIPAALCVGLVLAAAFQGARWVLTEVAERHSRRRQASRAIAALPRPPVGALVRLAPLAGGWSDRGPPR